MIWCTSSTTPGMVWCSCTTPSRRNAQTAAPRSDESSIRRSELHLVARPDAIRRDIQGAAVHLDVAVPHQLARLPARHGKAHPIDEIVEAALQCDEQRLTGHAGLLEHAIENVPELPLREPVDPLGLLFLAQLALIVRRLAPPPRRLTMLARRGGGPLHRALLGVQ